MTKWPVRLPMLALPFMATLTTAPSHAELLPPRGYTDSRVRQVIYDPEQVYRLRGYVGYHIHLKFEEGETFIGLGTGDIEGIAFAAQDNHLILKPKAPVVGTNLTLLTNRRDYQIDYTATEARPGREPGQVIYALRFIYPPSPEARRAEHERRQIEQRLRTATEGRSRNLNYAYCGRTELQPIAASDDGVQTRLRFGVRREIPAIFVRNEDGTESLLNFSVDDGEVVIHRVARQFIVRRGRTTGCIVNRAYSGSGEQLPSGTLTPGVQRLVPERSP